MAETKRMTAEQVVSYLLEEDGLDFLRESLTWVVQQLMEAEVSELVGPLAGERAPEERLTHRNGYRARTWATRAGEIELAIPKIRRGSYFPSFLEPRRRPSRRWSRSCRRPTSPASRPGRSTRSSSRWGCGSPRARSRGSARAWTSRSTRSATGRSRAATPTCGSTPRSRRSATAAASSGKRWCSPTRVHESGYREVIGLDVGEAETEAFWRSFLRGLVERGLTGVQLVVSDAHAGLKKAIGAGARLPLAALQRPLPPRSARARPPRAAADAGRADPPDLHRRRRRAGRELVGAALERLRKPLPKIAELLEEAEDDLLAFYAFPADHWPKLRSTNPLERVNREIGRRTDVVGIFPNDRSLIRLAASVVIEQNDEWLVGQPLPQPAHPGRDPHRLRRRQQQKGDPRARRSMNTRRVTPRPGNLMARPTPGIEARHAQNCAAVTRSRGALQLYARVSGARLERPRPEAHPQDLPHTGSCEGLAIRHRRRAQARHDARADVDDASRALGARGLQARATGASGIAPAIASSRACSAATRRRCAFACCPSSAAHGSPRSHASTSRISPTGCWPTGSTRARSATR